VFALAAIALDAAVQVGHIVSQRLIYGIDPAARGRMNAVYMTSIFLAGAVGSLLAGVTYFYGGWEVTAATGVALGLLLLALFAGDASGRGSTPPAQPPRWFGRSRAARVR
jgi:MFS family permease